jgi:hypothetical protein
VRWLIRFHCLTYSLLLRFTCVVLCCSYAGTLDESSYVTMCASQEYKATWWMLTQYILRDNLLLTGVFFFALVMGFAIT